MLERQLGALVKKQDLSFNISFGSDLDALSQQDYTSEQFEIQGLFLEF